jgi:hypothetical protein
VLFPHKSLQAPLEPFPLRYSPVRRALFLLKSSRARKAPFLPKPLLGPLVLSLRKCSPAVPEPFPHKSSPVPLAPFPHKYLQGQPALSPHKSLPDPYRRLHLLSLPAHRLAVMLGLRAFLRSQDLLQHPRPLRPRQNLSLPTPVQASLFRLLRQVLWLGLRACLRSQAPRWLLTRTR